MTTVLDQATRLQTLFANVHNNARAMIALLSIKDCCQLQLVEALFSKRGSQSVVTTVTRKVLEESLQTSVSSVDCDHQKNAQQWHL